MINISSEQLKKELQLLDINKLNESDIQCLTEFLISKLKEQYEPQMETISYKSFVQRIQDQNKENICPNTQECSQLSSPTFQKLSNKKSFSSSRSLQEKLLLYEMKNYEFKQNLNTVQMKNEKIAQKYDMSNQFNADLKLQLAQNQENLNKEIQNQLILNPEIKNMQEKNKEMGEMGDEMQQNYEKEQIRLDEQLMANEVLKKQNEQLANKLKFKEQEILHIKAQFDESEKKLIEQIQQLSNQSFSLHQSKLKSNSNSNKNFESLQKYQQPIENLYSYYKENNINTKLANNQDQPQINTNQKEKTISKNQMNKNLQKMSTQKFCCFC